MSIMPSLYIPHGGGPCFFMEWEPPHTWNSMKNWLSSLGSTLPKPQAILVISAHWEEETLSLQAQEAPSLLYDYYGFPDHTYKISYPAPGSPPLAQKIKDLFAREKIDIHLNRDRGFDHGVFIPLKVIYPEASIPILQLSLKKGLGPAFHIKMGKILAPLRQEGILILGSGMSFHNLQAFFHPSDQFSTASLNFDQWLEKSLQDISQREKSLIEWKNAPYAQSVHPREEHLIPLMVIAGTAEGDPAKFIYREITLGLTISAVQFGAEK